MVFRIVRFLVDAEINTFMTRVTTVGTMVFAFTAKAYLVMSTIFSFDFELLNGESRGEHYIDIVSSHCRHPKLRTVNCHIENQVINEWRS